MLDDAALNARVIAGDQTAFSELVLRHEHRLRAFLARVAGPSSADDLAQDAFLKAWRRARQYDGRGSYRAWLFRIGWRTCLDARRQAALRDRVEAAAGVLALSSAIEPGHESRMDLDTAISRLGRLERAALQLCEGEGWTHAEASEALAMPLGTLKSVVARAKRQVRTHLNLETP